MILRSDLIICTVERDFGGAYMALRYTEDQKKENIILNDK